MPPTRRSPVFKASIPLIGGLYKQVIAADGDEAATAGAIDNLMGAKKTTVDNLIVDMGELYNAIKVADASTGASLIKVYDNMAALSYNWGAAAAPARQSYRDTISEVWVGCATMLYVICGADAYKDEYPYRSPISRTRPRRSTHCSIRTR